MQKIKLIIFSLLCITILAGCSKNNINQSQTEDLANNNQPQQISECENAGGVISLTDECDGSKSEWCKISEKEQCYSDQIKNGRCIIGRYDEELDGIVGITPRVLCDGQGNGQ